MSNFPRGGATGRGAFHAKVLVLFIKNGHLPLQLIKKKYGGNAGGLSEKVLQLCLLLTDISGSLKILDNISVILSTKKYDTNTSLSFSSLTSPWCSKRLH